MASPCSLKWGWWVEWDSNPRPRSYEPLALTAELSTRCAVEDTFPRLDGAVVSVGGKPLTGAQWRGR